MTALHAAPRLLPFDRAFQVSAVKEMPPSLSLLKHKAGEGGGGGGTGTALQRVDSTKEQVREDVNVRRFKF